MSCKYSATGSIECVESFSNKTADLGEECSSKPCSEGLCVAPYGRGRGAYCYNVINKGETGCEKSYSVCNKGLYCKKNVCIEDTTDDTTQQDISNAKKDESPKKREQEKKENKNNQGMLLVYILLGLVILILCILIAVLIWQSS